MPFILVLNALAAYASSHISAILFAVTTIGLLGTVEYLNPGYLALLANTTLNLPSFTIGPATSLDLLNASANFTNVTCRIITDLTVYQPTPVVVPFWQAALQKYSFENVHAVAWDFVRIYNLIWDTLPDTLTPFVCLLIYLSATWHLWLGFHQILRLLYHYLLRREAGESDEVDFDPSWVPLPPSPPESPSQEITPYIPPPVSWRITATFWWLLYRVFRKNFKDTERDLNNARTRIGRVSTESGVSGYKGQIAKLQQELASLRSKQFTESVQKDEIKKLRFDLASRNNDLKLSQRQLEVSRKELNKATVQINSFKKSNSETTAKTTEQEDRLHAQAAVLRSLQTGLDNAKADLDKRTKQPLAYSGVQNLIYRPGHAPAAYTTIRQHQATQTEFSKGSPTPLEVNVEAQLSPQATPLTEPLATGTINTPISTSDSPKTPSKESSPSLALTPTPTKLSDLSSEDSQTLSASLSPPKSSPPKRSRPTAQNVVIAHQRYEAAFPHGFNTLFTSSKDWHCGLDAIIKTMKAMYPDRQCPTIDDLKTIVEQSEWIDTVAGILPAVDSITDWFTPDMLDMILRKWAEERGYHYRLGYIQYGFTGVEPFLCVGPRNDRYEEDVVWVFIAHEFIAGFETGHYEAVEPKKPKELGPEDTIDIETPDPGSEDYHSSIDSSSPKTSIFSPLQTEDKKDVPEFGTGSDDTSSTSRHDTTSEVIPSEAMLLDMGHAIASYIRDLSSSTTSTQSSDTSRASSYSTSTLRPQPLTMSRKSPPESTLTKISRPSQLSVSKSQRADEKGIKSTPIPASVSPIRSASVPSSQVGLSPSDVAGHEDDVRKSAKSVDMGLRGSKWASDTKLTKPTVPSLPKSEAALDKKLAKSTDATLKGSKWASKNKLIKPAVPNLQGLKSISDKEPSNPADTNLKDPKSVPDNEPTKAVEVDLRGSKWATDKKPAKPVDTSLGGSKREPEKKSAQSIKASRQESRSASENKTTKTTDLSLQESKWASDEKSTETNDTPKTTDTSLQESKVAPDNKTTKVGDIGLQESKWASGGKSAKITDTPNTTTTTVKASESISYTNPETTEKTPGSKGSLNDKSAKAEDSSLQGSKWASPKTDNTNKGITDTSNSGRKQVPRFNPENPFAQALQALQAGSGTPATGSETGTSRTTSTSTDTSQSTNPPSTPNPNAKLHTPAYASRATDIPDTAFKPGFRESSRVDQWNRHMLSRYLHENPHLSRSDVVMFPRFKVRFPELYKEQEDRIARDSPERNESRAAQVDSDKKKKGEGEKDKDESK